MTEAETIAADDDPPCTDCGGFGITYQTERPCTCDEGVRAALAHAHKDLNDGQD